MNMKKLRIAIVCDAIDNFTAGSFVSALRFSELLHKKEHKVIIITSRYPNESYIDYYKDIKIYRMKSFLVPGSNKKLYFAYPNSKKIKTIFEKEKINILHFMVPTPLSLSSLKSVKNTSIKIIAHSHTQPENWIAYTPKLFSKLKINNLLTFLAYKYIIHVYNKSDAVICPSEFSQNILKTRGIKIKTYVVSNGVNAKIFKRINLKHIPDKFKLSKENKKLLFVGRLDPEKNLKLFLESAVYIKKKFKNFEILIIGDGLSRQDLEKLAKELNIFDKVKFFGRVSDKDLIMFYNLCDIFVLPSLVELEGMVVLEAMSCGKPILIANSPNSASKYFVKKNGFLFNFKDPLDLAKKAIILLKDNKKLKEMSKESYKLSKNFNINESISKLERIYSNLF